MLVIGASLAVSKEGVHETDVLAALQFFAMPAAKVESFSAIVSLIVTPLTPEVGRCPMTKDGGG